MPRYIDYATDVADILQSASENGYITVTLGDSRDDVGFSAEAPMWGMDGFISRPNDPSPDGAAQAFFINDGNQSRVVASRDNRFNDKVGTMEPGDRAIVTDGEARIFIKQKTDSIALYTASQPDDGQAMMLTLSGEDGEITLSCAGSFLKMRNDKITIGVAGGKTILTLDANGFHVDGNYCSLNTGGGHLGALSKSLGLAIAPFPVINAILTGPVALAGAPSTKWTVAP